MSYDRDSQTEHEHTNEILWEMKENLQTIGVALQEILKELVRLRETQLRFLGKELDYS